MSYTSLKSDYINELLKYPVRFDNSLVFFKESYKGCFYFSWLAFLPPNKIELASNIYFTSSPINRIVYAHSNLQYDYYSLKDLESFKSQLKILYHLFKSAIIQAKLYTLNKDF